MIVDVLTLRAFYQSALGQKARQAICDSLRSNWTLAAGDRLLAMGYGLPFLDDLARENKQAFAFMPASFGATIWPAANCVATALVDVNNLPVSDGVIDQILMVHMLEFAENAECLLQEAWRVLAPGGRLVIAAANRRGLWARSENTPFGHGEPYSGHQLLRLLRNTNYSVASLSHCLYFSPSPRLLPRALAYTFSSITERYFPYFGGIVVVFACKNVQQKARRRISKPLFIPSLAPQPTMRSQATAKTSST